MKKAAFLILSIIIVFSFLTGCDYVSKSDGPFLVQVDKAGITEKDFIQQVSRVPDWAWEQFKGKEGKEKFLEEMIKRELIYNEAIKMRLHKDKEYLDKLKEFKKMTLIALLLKKEIEDKVQITDEEVKAFFEQNEDKFTIGSQLKASHILVETEDMAKGIYERIKNGEDFAKLAKELSKDKVSAAKGGDLGYFGRGKMVPEFERAAIRLKPGEVSLPVRTRFGFHIIKLVDIKKGKPANFEQSKDPIKRQLRIQKQKRLLDNFVEKLKAESKIIKNEELIATMTLPWEKAEEKTSEEKPPVQ